MRRIDEPHLEHPFAGARMLRDVLRQEGHRRLWRKHVGTLMQRMGVEALYRRPNTSRKHPAHTVYPYLLRDCVIERPYIPMRRGFVYLVAVMDWASRRILAWRTSISLTTDFCPEAVEEALAKYGRPEIFNTDQGSQFTSTDFTDLLEGHGIAISMVGKGAGATMCSSSASGSRSSTRRSTCTPMTASAKLVPASGATSSSTIPAGHINRLAALRLGAFTLIRCRSSGCITRRAPLNAIGNCPAQRGHFCLPPAGFAVCSRNSGLAAVRAFSIPMKHFFPGSQCRSRRIIHSPFIVSTRRDGTFLNQD